MSDFATYRKGAKPKGRTTGCPRCGDPAKPVGQVSATMRELGPQGRVNGGNQLASRSRSFCESCTVAVYEQFVAELARGRDGEQAP